MGKIGLLHSYSAKMGSNKVIKPHITLEKPIGYKWRGELPITFQPRWNEVWFPRRPQKEAGFLWSIYHTAIAVNAWQNKINDQISDLCTSSAHNAPEAGLHRMALWPRAKLWWQYSLSILYEYCAPCTASSAPIFRAGLQRLKLPGLCLGALQSG